MLTPLACPDPPSPAGTIGRVRKLIVALVVLALLLVGADIAGRLIAQQKASQAIATKLATATEPSVRIHGFSFLLQAVGGDYSHITATSNDLTVGPVNQVSAQVDLYDVTLPLSDALGGKVEELTAKRAQLRAVIPGDQLTALLQQPGMTLAPAADGTVRVSTTIAVDGRTFPITVDVGITIADGSLTLTARPITAAGVQVPAALAGELQKRLTTSIPLRSLPFPLDNATVTAQDGNLVVAATADNVDARQLNWAVG